MNRIAALAPWRLVQSSGRARKSSTDRIGALASWQLSHIPEGTGCHSRGGWHVAKERAQRRGRPASADRCAPWRLSELSEGDSHQGRGCHVAKERPHPPARPPPPLPPPPSPPPNPPST